eukprot:TRINITY_DN11322_c2_g1_i1.p1 TRINITY_DN11322_c2_g1~~TRINITY_DN11322_c2_g1_i1.p1  ORF type:complete len:434 (+),score=98.87 TRINITY_DN11322_c2_g1_i1:78-1304(+)
MFSCLSCSCTEATPTEHTELEVYSTLPSLLGQQTVTADRKNNIAIKQVEESTQSLKPQTDVAPEEVRNAVEASFAKGTEDKVQTTASAASQNVVGAARGPVKESVEEAAHSEELREFHSAVREYRMVAAGEVLKKLEATGKNSLKDVDPAIVESVRRISSQYAAHRAANFGDGVDWTLSEKNEKLKSEWSVTLADGYIHFSRTQIIDGSGACLVKAVAGICEMQLWGEFKEDFVSASILGNSSAANDVAWHVFTHDKGMGSKLDNIWQMSITDAFDEVEGAVFVDLSLPSKTVTELHGAQLPAVAEGHGRWEEGSQHFRFVPLEKDKSGAFRLINNGSVKLDRVSNMFLSVMPNFMLRRFLRSANDAEFEKTLAHLKGSKSIDEVSKSSKLAPLYQRLRTRIHADLLK